MNADISYEQHTDLVRALRRSGSPERAWFDDYHATLGLHPLSQEPQELFALGDFTVVSEQARSGQGVHTSLIVGYTPDPPKEPGDDQVAGVLDPQALRSPQPQADVPAQLAFPRNILTEVAVAGLAAAPTLYVTPDMVAVLEHAAGVLDDTDVMPYSPSFPSGFAVLARPLRLPYGDGTEQVVHAFGWDTLGQVQTPFGQAGHGGLVWQFADRTLAPQDRGVLRAQGHYSSRRAWADAPRLTLNVVDQYVTGAPVGRTTQSPADVETIRQRLLDALDAPERTERPVTVPKEAMGRFQPYLAALLLLLDQQITQVRQESANEHARKRARRAGRQQPGVTIVDLAPRHSDPTDEPETGERGHRYTTRHLVGGYWRWQPYGPGRRLRRRIYVADYVRGPEDAPLIIKPRVHRV
jgi:hypothetical protein